MVNDCRVTDNENLIKEAAKAISDLHASSYVDEHDRATARAALAVFEKALGEATVTPTDDEREALIGLGLATESFRDTDGQMSVKVNSNETAAEKVLAAGFRRTAVPEPSAACPECGVIVTDQTPSTFYINHDETCGGPLEEPQDAVVTLTAEAVKANREYIERTQGEPSDAQVRAERAYATALYPDIPWGRLTNATRHDIEVGVRAALRAAGGAR